MTTREARCAARRRWRERNPTYQTEYMRKWRSDPYNRDSEQAKRHVRKHTNGTHEDHDYARTDRQGDGQS